jgi:hypothetical protein
VGGVAHVEEVTGRGDVARGAELRRDPLGNVPTTIGSPLGNWASAAALPSCSKVHAGIPVAPLSFTTVKPGLVAIYASFA